MANTFTSYMNKNVGTSPATVVTVGASTQTTIIGLDIANTTSSPITADVYVTRSAVDYYLIKSSSACWRFFDCGRCRPEGRVNYLRRSKSSDFCCQLC